MIGKRAEAALSYDAISQSLDTSFHTSVLEWIESAFRLPYSIACSLLSRQRSYTVGSFFLYFGMYFFNA